MARTLDSETVRRFYDWFGSWQDRQPYENRALEVLVSHGDFGRAHRILEFGCGTGRLAERLLRNAVPDDAQYVGIDISATMARIARQRLRPWTDRAVVKQATGLPTLNEPDGRFDRVIATYVLDLLSDDDASRVVAEAHRVLAIGGYVCLASLTFGERLASRVLVGLWRAAFAVHPVIVGGCRPVRLRDHFQSKAWRVVHHEVLTEWALPSEVLIAISVPIEQHDAARAS